MGPFKLECMLFVKQPTLQDTIWNGKPVTLDELRTIYQVRQTMRLEIRLRYRRYSHSLLF